IRVMYLGDRVADEQPLSLSPALQTAMVVALIGILFIGVYPQPFIVLAQKLMPAVASAPAPAANIPPGSQYTHTVRRNRCSLASCFSISSRQSQSGWACSRCARAFASFVISKTK